MTAIRLTVNGRKVAAEVEPRLQLADFLREHLLHTGTHQGCEHGVCGACTLLIDGAPARSCITYAVSCDGAEITTIEGMDRDETMAELRRAFTREHALQCGFCTPGMLATARDIVLRLPEADERRIRLELSGNLCRCTGYVGIVRAILERARGAQSHRPPSRGSAGKTLRPGRRPRGDGIHGDRPGRGRGCRCRSGTRGAREARRAAARDRPRDGREPAGDAHHAILHPQRAARARLAGIQKCRAARCLPPRCCPHGTLARQPCRGRAQDQARADQRLIRRRGRRPLGRCAAPRGDARRRPRQLEQLAGARRDRVRPRRNARG